MDVKIKKGFWFDPVYLDGIRVAKIKLEPKFLPNLFIRIYIALQKKYLVRKLKQVDKGSTK